ncbi:MAG: MFS transporter [candidate division Zixibacteria bacterium]|nr:MFS transporter [candidate division Zixibacteria bacterium]
MFSRLRNADSQMVLFVAGLLCFGMSMGLFESSFNNFLADTYNMDAETRGRLEFPRELPGFLVAAVAGALFFFSEIRVAAIALLLMAVGQAAIGLWGDRYNLMLVGMIVWSAGMHLQMPVTRAIALAMTKSGGGALLGRLSGWQTGAAILGSGLLWLGLGNTEWAYTPVFFLAALLSLVGGVVYLFMQPAHGQSGERPKFIFRRRYTLYYLLNILFGARKQVFITFGPWVLIKIFGEPVSKIALLNMIAAFFGMFLAPFIGRMIDRVGEKTVLMTDAVLMISVCLGYGFADQLGLGVFAADLICASFVLDQMLFNVGIARATYMRKIAERPEDVTATLSFGVTIDHVVSMSIPTVGGIVWMLYGYQYVFMGAACIAAMNLLATGFMRVPPPESEKEAAVQAAG